MRFDVSSTALSSRLQSVSKVIASKNSLPILDNFLFSLEGDTLTITAADAETRLVSSVQVMNAQGSGVFALSAKNILDPLKELPEQPLTFDINDNNLEIFIYFQNGKYNFIGTKGDTYPQQKPLNATAISISLDSKTLLNGINRSLFATADDELRPVMNGVYFDIQTDSLTFVASDGRKLVRLRNFSVKAPERASFILPKKPANILKNILPKESDDVKISFTSKNATMTMSNFELTCRLIEGRFPNYNSVIPTNNPNRVIVDRLMFLSALRRVLVFSNQSSALIKLHLEDNLLVISGQDYDFSTSAEERIPCSYDGPMFNIGFKGTFLTDILNNLTSTEVIIELADPSRAGVIIPAEQDENEDTLMLLMPMMLND